MTKVTLTLDDKGHVTQVEGVPLKIEGKKLGVECKCEGTIDYLNSIAILCKEGHSPCCIISGGEMWCWC